MISTLVFVSGGFLILSLTTAILGFRSCFKLKEGLNILHRDP